MQRSTCLRARRFMDCGWRFLPRFEVKGNIRQLLTTPPTGLAQRSSIRKVELDTRKNGITIYTSYSIGASSSSVYASMNNLPHPQPNESGISPSSPSPSPSPNTSFADPESSPSPALSSFWIPAELLRVYSPAAHGEPRARVGMRGSKLTKATTPFPSGKALVRVYKVGPVGRYGLQFWFDDLHSAGIYSWEQLLNLALNKRVLARRYISSLRAAGASRHRRIPREVGAASG